MFLLVLFTQSAITNTPPQSQWFSTVRAYFLCSQSSVKIYLMERLSSKQLTQRNRLFSSSWDRLGSGTLCCNARTWTPLLKQQNSKKLHGTKNNCVHAQLGQILDPKDTKRPKNNNNNQWPLLRSLEQKLGVGSKSTETLHTAPRERWADHLSHPPGQPWAHPCPHPI